EIVYAYRDRVLEGEDLGETTRENIADVIESLVEKYTPGDYIEEWDLDGLWAELDQLFRVDFGPEDLDREQVDRTELKRLTVDDAMKVYAERERELGDELMRGLERFLLLQVIDQRWREHLYDMDYLREGIHLRGFAQIDPLVAYKNEAFELFRDLMNTIWSDFARMIFHVEVEVEGENGDGAIPSRPAGGTSTTGGNVSYSGGVSRPNDFAMAAASAAAGAAGADAAAEEELEAAPVVQQRVVDEHQQLGRNDPCWCGSGKKFKRCHGA
ncbi:MAG: SEC-C metal-binding domain-containing protein, partial [Solirubrobacteraceae bacterium]